jgi:hypothetical protein
VERISDFYSVLRRLGAQFRAVPTERRDIEALGYTDV